MKNSSRFTCSLLILALVSACTGQYPNATRTLVGVSGYGITLELLSSSASAPAQGVESEVTVGKWASQAKRGSAAQHGRAARPGDAPGAWTAVTGGVGVITVTRFDPLPAEANALIYRAIDTTTNLNVRESGTLTGLVSGRLYRVDTAWYSAAGRISDYSNPVFVTAG